MTEFDMAFLAGGLRGLIMGFFGGVYLEVHWDRKTLEALKKIKAEIKEVK